MEYSFARYLLAKRTVDDRALNRGVFDALAASLPAGPVTIVEVGPGRLLTRAGPQGLAWLTINFDGVTTLEPTIDATLDAHIERLYHSTMDTRPTGGDSQSGRHLFGHLRGGGAEILAAGPSDWVVFARDGRYPADEAYFLHFILHFFEDSDRKSTRLNSSH